MTSRRIGLALAALLLFPPIAPPRPPRSSFAARRSGLSSAPARAAAATSSHASSPSTIRASCPAIRISSSLNVPGAARHRRRQSALQYASTRDGTVLAALQRQFPLAAAAVEPANAIRHAEINWLGSLNRETNVIVAWHTAPVKTVEDLFTTELVVGSLRRRRRHRRSDPLLLNKPLKHQVQESCAATRAARTSTSPSSAARWRVAAALPGRRSPAAAACG